MADATTLGEVVEKGNELLDAVAEAKDTLPELAAQAAAPFVQQARESAELSFALSNADYSETLWSALQPKVGTALNRGATVRGDAGTHNDPIKAGNPVVFNEGVYAWRAAGWEWMGPLSSSDVPVSTVYQARPMVVQRDKDDVLWLLIPALTIERRRVFTASNPPASQMFTAQPLSTTNVQRRHGVNPATGALSYVDGTALPMPGYNYELLASSVNGLVSSKYNVVGQGVGKTVGNQFPYSKDATDVVRISGGAEAGLVEVTDPALRALGLTKGFGNRGSTAAYYGMDYNDGIEAPYFAVRIRQQSDVNNSFFLPTITVTYTDGGTLQLNPNLEEQLSARAASYFAFGRLPVGKRVRHVLAGFTNGATGGRSIVNCGLQMAFVQEPALWIDRFDFNVNKMIDTRLKDLEKAVFVAPALTSPPAITGVAAVGNTLTANTGSWSGIPSISEYRYQWMRDDELIADATKNTYVVQSGDAGSVLACRVMAVNPAGSRSIEVGPVAVGASESGALLGQSNETSHGTSKTTDGLLDPTSSRVREECSAMGENLIADPNFERGIGDWSTTGNVSKAVVNNRLVATVQSVGFANCSLSFDRLIPGQPYRARAKVSHSLNKSLVFQMTGPQKQSYVIPSVDGTFVDVDFVPAGTESMMQLVTVAQAAVGDQMSIGDASLQPILSSGRSSIPAAGPLVWPEPSHVDYWGSTPPGVQFARRRVAAGVAMVTLLPLAVSGSGLVNGPWAVGGALFNNAVARMTAHAVANPSSTKTIFMNIGETDSINGVSQAAHTAGLNATLTALRAIPGWENAKIILGGMAPEFIVATAGAPAIVAAQQAVAGAMANVVYVPAPAGYLQADGLHFTAAGNRQRGNDWYDAYVA